jgi:hypothetical protein
MSSSCKLSREKHDLVVLYVTLQLNQNPYAKMLLSVSSLNDHCRIAPPAPAVKQGCGE